MIPLIVVAMTLLEAGDGTTWPTPHGDLQRSGFYSSFPDGPLRVLWRKELRRELTGTRAEVIVGRDGVYLGTYAGNVYCWDPATGAEKWRFRTAGPVMHSPMLAGSRLFVASMDRTLKALNATSGEELWSFEAGEGFWTSPVAFAGKVLVGSRDGVFHAIEAASGDPAWQLHTGGPILTTASVTRDGKRVVFASEDMHVYCARIADGELFWKSRKMHGLSVRDHYPTIVGDVAILTTNPVDDFHTVLTRHQELFLRLAGHEDRTAKVGKQRRYIPYSESGFRREQEAFLEHLRRVPSDQTFYAFRLSDGAEPWIAPIAYTCGLHNPPTPPCFDPRQVPSNEGDVKVDVPVYAYVYVRSAYGVWDGGGEVRPYSGVGRLDVRTGRVDLVVHGHTAREPERGAGRRDMPWGSFWTIGDEAQTLSLSPRWLFSNHQGSLGAMHRETGLCRKLFGKRDTYGGFYGPGRFGWGEAGRRKAAEANQPYGIVNEWHGPAKAIAAVAGGRVYYHTGSQVICLEAGP